MHMCFDSTLAISARPNYCKVPINVPYQLILFLILSFFYILQLNNNNGYKIMIDVPDLGGKHHPDCSQQLGRIGPKLTFW